MKLMIFYEYKGSEELFYKCLDIAKEDEPAKVVDDYIRSLRGWRNSVRRSLKKDPHMPEPSFVARYLKNKKGGKSGLNPPKLKVSFHLRDDKGAKISRKSFCSFVDTLKNNSHHGREVLKQTAKSQNTNDFEVEYLTELLLKNLQTHKNRPAQ